jgi:hypothetical protein
MRLLLLLEQFFERAQSSRSNVKHSRKPHAVPTPFAYLNAVLDERTFGRIIGWPDVQVHGQNLR